MNGTTLTLKSWPRLTSTCDRIVGLLYTTIRALAWPAAYLFFSAGVTANMVTVGRLLLSPIIFYLLAVSDTHIIGYIIAVALLSYTDAIDGLLSSERFEDKTNSDIGVMLDSGADKVMTISMYGYHYVNFPQLVVITSLCELALAVLSTGSVVLAPIYGQKPHETISKIRASRWGKTKIWLEIATVFMMCGYAWHPSLALEGAVYITGTAALLLLGASLMNKVKKILG